jgi:hypothetical protein
MTLLTLTSLKELDQAVHAVHVAGERTVRSLRDLLANEADSVQVLRLLKFSARVRPTGGERPLNLIEQVNHTLTSLARLQAARWVLEQHPELLVEGVCVHLGPHTGVDLYSVAPDVIAAEVFAASHPGRHDRLRQDVARLQEKAPNVLHRYVFFSCPGYALGRQLELETVPGIAVWSLPVEQGLKGRP